MPPTLRDIELADLLWRCFECAAEPVVAAISGAHPRCRRRMEDISFFESQVKRADGLLDECATAIGQTRFTEAELVPAQGWVRFGREFSEAGVLPPQRGGRVIEIPPESWKPDVDWGAARQGREMIKSMYDEASEALLCIIAMPIKVIGADRWVLPDPARCQYEEWKDEAREVEKHIAGLRNKLLAATRDGGLAAGSADAGDEVSPDQGNSLSKVGKAWSMTFNGVTFPIDDRKGLYYIAELLSNQGKPISWARLARAPGRKTLGRAASVGEMMEGQEQGAKLPAQEYTRGNEVVSKEGRKDIERELAAYARQIAQVEATGDEGMAALLTQEMDDLSARAQKDRTVAGRSKRMGDEYTRMVDRIRKAIQRTYEVIGASKQAGDLVGHLRSKIDLTGTPTYTGEVRWEVPLL